MLHEPNVAAVAALIADPARAAMLAALLDGRALPAGELAHASGVTAQTASSHLSKLLAGGLLSVETEGRHRYYRLAGPHVAQALEHLSTILPATPARRKFLTSEQKELRFVRRCYDHLAGQLGVAVAQSLERRKFIVALPGKRFDITPNGASWLAGIGLDLFTLKPSPHGLARQCLDWTERLHHVGGPLGVEFMHVLCANGWLRRSRETRAMRITPKGYAELKRHLGIDAQRLRERGLEDEAA